VLPALLNLVGSTCLMVWTITLASQWVLRRRADRDGRGLPFRMRGFPYVTLAGLGILGLIFALTLLSPDSRAQLLSTVVLTLAIAGLCAWAKRRGTTAG
jgi:AAT family amino acid transporter